MTGFRFSREWLIPLISHHSHHLATIIRPFRAGLVVSVCEFSGLTEVGITSYVPSSVGSRKVVMAVIVSFCGKADSTSVLLPLITPPLSQAIMTEEVRQLQGRSESMR